MNRYESEKQLLVFQYGEDVKRAKELELVSEFSTDRQLFINCYNLLITMCDELKEMQFDHIYIKVGINDKIRHEKDRLLKLVVSLEERKLL